MEKDVKTNSSAKLSEGMENKTKSSVNEESEDATNIHKVTEDPFGGEKLPSIISEANDGKECGDVEDKKETPLFVEDDGEDLPDNFFDDFSNHDFMAGLDIVDDWNDEDVGDSTEEIPETVDIHEKRNISSKHGRSPHRSNRDKHRNDNRSRRRHSKEDDRYYKDHRRRSRSRGRRRSRSRRSRSRRSRSKHDKNPVPTTEKSLSDNVLKTEPSIPLGDRNSEENAERNREIDRRRDPEKTKRDIQRDKIRCAKDQEARVFQEQLKVAETGLVPPGTELDVVLKSDKFKEDEEKELKKVEVEKVVVETKKEPKEEETKKEKLPEKRKAEAHSRTRHTRKPRRSTERPPRKERERSFSPKRRRRDSRSYDRERRNRSRHRDSRDVDLRYRIRQKRERFLKELSPVSDKRMSRSPSAFIISPESMMSDRETWLRHKNSRSRNSPYSKLRYSRSCSPISSNSLSDRDHLGSPRQRRSKKFSFMEEIEIKLRQNTPGNMFHELPPNPFNMVPAPNMMCAPILNNNPHDYFPPALMNIQTFPPNQPIFMGPAPTMCPPPDPFQHPIMMNSPDPNMVPHMMNLVNPPPLLTLHPQHIHPNIPQGMSPFPVPQGMSPFPVPQDAPPAVLMETPPNPNKINHKKKRTNLTDCTSQEFKLTKLFEDKKISLSDFLSVSAKTIDPSTPVSIHNKIKVISRCQEAIKLLEDPKLTGRFFPKISQQAIESEKRINEKAINQSPMRRAAVVRFNFTVPVGKRAANKLLNVPAPGVYLHKVLSILGLVKEAIPIPPPEESPIAPLPVPKPVPQPSPIVQVKKINMFTQTDPVKCQICETRNARKYTDIHTQTTGTSTVTVSTQVSVEDLNKSITTFIPRGILKNSSSVQSISHLTPAQLLAQLDKEKKEEISNKPWSMAEKQEIFPIGRGYSDKLPGNFNQDNNSRTMSGANINDNYKFIDSYRNINPFSDSYTGGGNTNTSSGIFGNNSTFKSSIANPLSKMQGDRFGNSYSGMTSGNTPTYDNRNEFMANQNRGGNFGSSAHDTRKFDASFTAGRRFPDTNKPSNFDTWNSASGRGNARNLSGNLPNKFFNPRSN